MRCPVCGSENVDEARFCQRCASPLGPGAAVVGAPVTGGQVMNAPTSAKKKDPTLWIVVIVIVVVLALVIGGTLLVMNAFNHTVNNATDVTMTVTGTSNPSGYSVAPGSGMTYYQVTLSMHNKGTLDVSVSWILFELKASGATYNPTTLVNNDTMTASIPAGGTATIKVSFLIPTTATPEKIVFNPIFGHEVSANL